MAIDARDLSTAEARRAYEAEYEALFTSIPATPARALARRFVRLDTRLDTGMTEVKSAMLVPSLLTSEEDQALGRWIHRQHSELARMGCEIVVASLGDDPVDEATARKLVAVSLLHLGESVKWELIAGRPGHRDYAALHELARVALERGWLDSPATLVIDRMERTATLDALYFRALLLDRFTSGSLSRQQVEVLDAFLWEWTPSLIAAKEPRGAVLRADLDSDHGLRYGERSVAGTCLYWSLDALEARRRSVIDAFHAGRIVPSRGRASEIRLEAHVAVLSQLQRTFVGDEGRAPREPPEVTRVEAWVGLTDITHVLQLQGPAGASVQEASPVVATRRADKFDDIYERPHRWLAMLDASDTGWLLEARGKDSAGLVVGELVALQFHAESACVLGCVVRSVQRADGDGVEVGVQRLSNPALPMRPCALRSDKRDEGTYIFVPGDDSSGQRDSFVVPYRLLETNERFLVKRDGREFAFNFNRVRRRGRGWAVAGYEMVDASAWEIIVA